MKEKEIKENIKKKEDLLMNFATKSSDAIRINETKEDLRPPFFRDVDKIIHSMAYTRYSDKTQVHSFSNNDHITTRIIHVTLVSKIARTIGRFLNLNEDLIEAQALGHDIGHTPLGHVGERFLDAIAKEKLNEPFLHNVQSVRNYIDIEPNTNLTIQVLDGMMCHNGEMLNSKYEPIQKTKEVFLEEYEKCLKDEKFAKKIRPMTIEGCVVRISDIIAYIGRDIEDAIRLGKLTKEDIPNNIRNTLGSSNKEIINTIILDIVTNSYGHSYIKLSEEVFDTLNKLKKFNYENIYHQANSDENLNYYQKGMSKLYEKYLKDIELKNKESNIYLLYLNDRDDKYLKNTKKERMVIDFIAGMTDDFYITEVDKLQ